MAPQCTTLCVSIQSTILGQPQWLREWCLLSLLLFLPWLMLIYSVISMCSLMRWMRSLTNFKKSLMLQQLLWLIWRLTLNFKLSLKTICSTPSLLRTFRSSYKNSWVEYHRVSFWKSRFMFSDKYLNAMSKCDKWLWRTHACRHWLSTWPIEWWLYWLVQKRSSSKKETHLRVRIPFTNIFWYLENDCMYFISSGSCIVEQKDIVSVRQKTIRITTL